MKTLITLSFIIITSISFGQSNSIDCEKKLDNVPYFVSKKVNSGKDSSLSDFEILKVCGKLDSIDSEMLNGTMLGAIMVQLGSEGKEITYRSILNSINEFKQTDNYKTYRDLKILENKTVVLSDWEKDKQILINVGMSEQEIADLKKYVEIHAGEKMTYKQAYSNYLNSGQ